MYRDGSTGLQLRFRSPVKTETSLRTRTFCSRDATMRDVCRMTVRGKFETCLLFVFGGSKRGRFERTSRALVMSHETCSCVYLLLCVKEKKTRNVYLHEGDTCDSFVPVTSQPRSQPHLLSSSRVLSFLAATATSVERTFRGDRNERRKQAVRGPMGKLLSPCTSST